MLKKIGVQLYTIRDYMQTAADIRESFKKLKDMGIDQAQTAGCAIPYEEYGAIAKEEGIEIVGTHDSFDIMRDDFDLAYKNHQALGTNIMGIGGYFKLEVPHIEQFIKDANVVCSKIGAKGGKFTYHNHSGEFIRLSNGKTMMEMLLEDFDTTNGSFCLDTYWVQHGGGDVRHWIEKLSGKIDILHLKDMAKNPETQFITEIGNGNLYWEGILESAEKAGVKYYVIEQDTCPGDPFDSLKQSVNYLKRFMV